MGEGELKLHVNDNYIRPRVNWFCFVIFLIHFMRLFLDFTYLFMLLILVALWLNMGVAPTHVELPIMGVSLIGGQYARSLVLPNLSSHVHAQRMHCSPPLTWVMLSACCQTRNFKMAISWSTRSE